MYVSVHTLPNETFLNGRIIESALKGISRVLQASLSRRCDKLNFFFLSSSSSLFSLFDSVLPWFASVLPAEKLGADYHSSNKVRSRVLGRNYSIDIAFLTPGAPLRCCRTNRINFPLFDTLNDQDSSELLDNFLYQSVP